jgi:hypothetical protein
MGAVDPDIAAVIRSLGDTFFPSLPIEADEARKRGCEPAVVSFLEMGGGHVKELPDQVGHSIEFRCVIQCLQFYSCMKKEAPCCIPTVQAIGQANLWQNAAWEVKIPMASCAYGSEASL